MHFTKLKSLTTITDRSPKAWFNYTRKFFEESFHRIGLCYKHNTLNSLANLLSLSKQFWQYVNLPSINNVFTNFILLRKPSGYLNFAYKISDFETKYAHHPWLFELNSALRLNISVHSIDFSSERKFCFFGYLCVHFHDVVIFHLTPVQLVHLWKTRDSFCYCGQHSAFNLYTSFTKIYISIGKLSSIRFHFEASFTVVDKSVVENVFLKSASYNLAPEQIFLFPRLDLIVVYFLQVKRLAHILLHLHAFHISFTKGILYDYPFLSSNFVTLTSQFFETSTFQCVLSVWINESHRFLKNTSHFSFQQKPVNQSDEFYLAGHTPCEYVLPNQKCFENHCLYRFSADNNSHINITTMSITYNGAHSADCKFGAFLTAEMLPDEYVESQLVCETHEPTQRQSRHLYSIASTLFVVVFWYVNYSNITVFINAQLTVCDVVKVDVCSVLTSCFHNDFGKCLSHVRYALRYSSHWESASIYYAPITHVPLLQFSHVVTSCTVIHTVFENYGSGDRWGQVDQYCHAGFETVPRKPLNPATLIKMELKASFSDIHHKFLDRVKVEGPKEFYVFKLNSSWHKQPHMFSKLLTLNPYDVTAVVFSTKTLKADVLTLSPTRLLLDITIYNETKVFQDGGQNKVFVDSLLGPPTGSSELKCKNRPCGDLVVATISKTKFEDERQRYYTKVQLTQTFDCESFGVEYDKAPQGQLSVTLFLKFSSLERTRSILHPGDTFRFTCTSSYFQDYYLDSLEQDKESIHPSSLVPRTCVSPNFAHRHDVCLKFSFAMRANTTYSMVSGVCPQISWIHASKLCSHLGAELLHFSGREELEELIALVSLSQHIPPIEAVYLGLSYRHNLLVGLTIVLFAFNTDRKTFLRFANHKII